MNAKSIYNCLPLLMKNNSEIDINVAGISMQPELFENDIITITRCRDYFPGDIIAFLYKDGLIVHRLLKKDEKFYCKGDNSFRLEDVNFNDIIGKITKVNGRVVNVWNDWKVSLSYSVNRVFVKSEYSVEKTKESNIYKVYSDLILKQELSAVKYKRNESMEYIENSEESMIVFDSQKEIVHFLDSAGIEIISILSNEKSKDEILHEISRIYNITIAEIKEDVERFLADAVQKNIIVTF